VARIEPEDVMTPRLAGQPGHGSTAFLPNQPARIRAAVSIKSWPERCPQLVSGH
jgi:hypothetical protein